MFNVAIAHSRGDWAEALEQWRGSVVEVDDAWPAQISTRHGASASSAWLSTSGLKMRGPNTKVFLPSMFQRQPWNGQMKPFDLQLPGSLTS
jgi:hypothetical protein